MERAAIDLGVEDSLSWSLLLLLSMTGLSPGLEQISPLLPTRKIQPWYILSVDLDRCHFLSHATVSSERYQYNKLKSSFSVSTRAELHVSTQIGGTVP